MMKNLFQSDNTFLCLLLMGVFFVACTPRQRYERKVQEELASGVRNDSLFMNLRLGMTSKEFYATCWELNKKGLIRQGNHNESVLYELDDELNHPADMNFYPSFHKDKIYEMPVRFNYKNWAPWNRNLWSDSLQLDVVNLFKAWYGDEFMVIKHPDKGKAFVKVDGNRRISIYKTDDQFVWAYFTDLTVKNELQSSDSTKLNM